jgi:hypothetical protein
MSSCVTEAVKFFNQRLFSISVLLITMLCWVPRTLRPGKMGRGKSATMIRRLRGLGQNPITCKSFQVFRPGTQQSISCYHLRELDF